MNHELNQRFLTARTNYIRSAFQSLNPMQCSAVLATQGPLLLLAGAGSGKTTVLINRIANLIRFGSGSDSQNVPGWITQEDVEFLENLPLIPDAASAVRADRLCQENPAAPWTILAITFTNKAANELKDRLCRMLGEDQAKDVWAMTFHSACCRILRRDIEALGYSRSFTIYDSADSERVMKEIVREVGLDDKLFPAKMLLQKVSRLKDSMVSAEEFSQEARSSDDLAAIQLAKCYRRYQARLKEHNALDFDDIIYLTVELLRQNPEILQYYQRKFRYVLVDEYQDTNHMQYLLASLLAGGHKNLCVVGDDDQSIYRFRGATIENILNFEEQYPNARTIRLEQNYRSTQAILNAANAVISNNRGRKGKKLWTDNGTGDLVTAYEGYNEVEEANYVAGRILAMSKGKGFSNFAVLYRTNAQSNAMEYSFKRNGIPYRIIGGTRFFDRAEVKDMLAYLWVINNRSDDLRLMRIVNNPPRGLGAKTLETAQRLARAQEVSLYEVLQKPQDYAALEKPAAKLKAFADLIEGLAQLLDEGMTLEEFYDEVVQRTGYAQMLQMKPTEENKTRLENVRELKSSIRNYAESTENPTLSGFLEEIALYTDIEQYDPNADAAVMMTIHSAKGLEFDHVFVVGMEDGLFPGIRAIGNAEEMEEERRLCYVAITRARKTLDLTRARQRMLYGRTSSAMASRFLREIPEECIQKKGGVKPQTERPATSQTGYGNGYNTYASNRISAQAAARKEKIQRSTKSVYTAQPVQSTMLELQKGDTVEHTAFGRGLVVSAMKVGNDALLEIAFDQTGTKRLMAKTASAHMKKL